jgi:hypothetical protein
VRRLFLHRPSAATVIALIALFFAMGGTAVAATGGNFILGKANTATSTTSLTNSKGTALSLSSTPTTPPLKVSNSVQVPNLNASELGGKTSSAFLPVKGTAANSSELGGQPASDYMTGSGQVSHTTNNIPYNNTVELNLPSALSNIYQLSIICSDGQEELEVTGTDNVQVWYSDILREDGWATLSAGGQPILVGPIDPGGIDMVQVQAAFLSDVVTTEVSMFLNPSAQTCNYAAQSISNG